MIRIIRQILSIGKLSLALVFRAKAADKPKGGRRFYALFCLCALMLLLNACARGDLEEINKEGPDTLYNQALANFDAQRYSEAIRKFQAIEQQFPYSPFVRKALIMAAYTNYLRRDYDAMIASASRFLTLYPEDPQAAYASYLVGTGYFEKIADVTRDQTDARNCASAFKELLRRYPKSVYAPAALVRMRYAREHLAAKEMQVGRFYQYRQSYLSALSRYKVVIEEYSDTNQIEEALYRSVEVNITLGLKSEARRFAAILGQNFPKSSWYKYAYDLINKKG